MEQYFNNQENIRVLRACLWKIENQVVEILKFEFYEINKLLAIEIIVHHHIYYHKFCNIKHKLLKYADLKNTEKVR